VGNFAITLRQLPRYVDQAKCVACGLCAEKCPKKVTSEYDAGLSRHKAIYLQYPQAVPLKYVIDPKTCLYFVKKGKCRACEKFCPNGAINFQEQEQQFTLRAGAIILATGSTVFNPAIANIHGYNDHRNVLTSLELERILCASGPFHGQLVRPSDHQEPNRIAWLQCVGSRDMHRCSNGYCSAVCCMYAVKQAIVAKEHSATHLDTTIFFMDMRTYGKDFDRYFEQARQEHGVRFIRSRIHSVAQKPGSDDLLITYVDDRGGLHEESFDMVVLSVGLETSTSARKLADKLGIALDNYHFAVTSSFTPVSTSMPGIYACGSFLGPRDIPSSVTEASAAACAASTALASARGSLVQEKSFPEEQDVAARPPRIGVFVCNCGVNIGRVVRVAEVVNYAASLAHVIHVEENLFSCSQDVQEQLRQVIIDKRLNRVVVAACSPRTHEPLFQETLKTAGLNPFLLEMTNIRDQNSWVHQDDPDAATEKAKDLVRMAVARAALLEPLQEELVAITPSALVIGGGVAGMTSALSLAEQGFKSYLVEKKEQLGGHALQMRTTWKGEDVSSFVANLVYQVQSHPKIEVFTSAEIIEVKGFVGNFLSTIVTPHGNRKIDHGVAIIATGARALEPDEYLYKKSDLVFCWHELEAAISNNPEMVQQAKAAAFIQCVGSREPARPYCSKICCTHSVQMAIKLKEMKPELQVFVLYRDLRTYGPREDLYTEARKQGVIFVRYQLENKPVVQEATGPDGGKFLRITVTDHVLGLPVTIEADFLNLATAIYPEDHERVAQLFKVPLNNDKFFLEAHMKLRPVDFATDGVFLCGMAHYPKPLEESIAQAQAAAARAATILAKQFVTVEPIVSSIDQEKCIGCGLCQTLCPFGAMELEEIAGVGFRAVNIAASCKGCGLCASSCPEKAIDMLHFRDSQLMAIIAAV